MVVVLAAVWAYRCHYLYSNSSGRNKQESQQQEDSHVEVEGNSSSESSTEKDKQETYHYLPSAESIGRSSSEFLARAALGCTTTDSTATKEDSLKHSSNIAASSVRTLSNKSKKQRRGKRNMASSSLKENGNHHSNGATNHDELAPSQPISPPGSPVNTSVFDPEVRQEWINAVFGPSFFPLNDTTGYTPPRQGTGLSGISHYVSYGIRIPPIEDGNKVGVTLSKIALGVWVRHVEVGSQAHAAGIEEGSVLVSINGMGLLAEPSKQALERLWQYEGHFSDSTKDTPPVVMLTLIKNGKLYTAVTMSPPPFGISWAPCGNFCLVQRSYSHALQAGVRRGCLVAAIHDKSMRTMSHSDAANELKELAQSQSEITMKLVYTPGAARAGHYERDKKPKMNSSSSPRKEPLISQEGIEIRVHPLEYSLGSFLFRKEEKTTTASKRGGVSELALQVAAGQVEAPTRRQKNGVRSSNTYGPCPTIDPSRLYIQWDAMDALGYLLRFYNASYQHDSFQSQHVSLGKVDSNDGLLRILSLEDKEACQLVGAFLLPFVSTLCLSNAIYNEENDDVATVQTKYDAAAREAKVLTSFVLKLAGKDADFGQRLYFLLQSYTLTLEGQRKSSKNDDASKRLLGLLQTLDLLKSAEKQLSDQIAMVEETKLLNGHASQLEEELQLKASLSDDSGVKSSDSPKKMGGKKKKSMLRGLYKKSSSKQQNGSSKEVLEQRLSPNRTSSPQPVVQSHSVSKLLDNMSLFLGELNSICDSIERSLLKSVSKKIADWALQPWTTSKETALAKVTDVLREGLKKASSVSSKMPLVNPMNSSELLVAVDCSESYILPSAHFPLLLTFVVQDKPTETNGMRSKQLPVLDTMLREERMYRTRVEIVAMRGSISNGGGQSSGQGSRYYFVQGAVSGTVKESGRSLCQGGSKSNAWDKNNVMTFDTRSSWGAPRTLALRLSSVEVDEDGMDQVVHTDDLGRLHYSSVVGSCWVDLRPMWQRLETMKRKRGGGFSTVTCHAQMLSLDDVPPFDQHGELAEAPSPAAERLELELRVTTETLEFNQAASGFQPRKRMLLYKHDDDLRQEMFAIECIKVCDEILKASGLDMKLLTFGCMPVGAKRGFIEWVPGSVPLSDICAPPGIALLGSSDDDSRGSDFKKNLADLDDDESYSEVAKAGLTKYQYFQSPPKKDSTRGSLSNNPIQDYLRSAAYDSQAPYLIQKEVMDNYVKSCAGYCVLTYLLGVGDRHLDNLLLHLSGHFFHCDYSFILGNDPKKYLPMRITEDMVLGMGGRDSDNYAMFLSLAGAAYVTFRRHENVRVLLSLVRLMAPSSLPDVSVNCDAPQVLLSMRDRLRLDLTDSEAISYMEELIETSIASKMWVAVDAIHSLGKRF